MRAATQNELEDVWFAQPDDVIARIEDAIHPARGYGRLALVLAIALAVTVLLAVGIS